MKIVNYIFGISLALLILIGIEALLTAGDALDFENYTIVGWIAQILAIIMTITLSIKLIEADYEKENQTNN